MDPVASLASFEATHEAGETGLVGTLEVAIIDNDGNVVFGPTSAGITENSVGGTPTGIYTAELTAPEDLGQYTLVWSPDGTFDPETVSSEGFSVRSAFDAGVLPPIDDGDEGALYGPCTAWVTPTDIDECCSLPEGSDLLEIEDFLERLATSASQILNSLAGRQFTGLCQSTVRPCRIGCPCGFQVLSRGHIIGWNDSGSIWSCEDRSPCGCSPLSQIKLSGYPVREILEVKIDGDVVDDSTYELRERRYLVRLNGERWPSCQTMDLADTEDGTFSVTYTHGQTAPQMGRNAAAQLACEMYKSCNGIECALPIGATRVTRQGITIERTFFQQDDSGVWRTGMPFVDGFLNAVNPRGLIRRPTFWAPGRRYPRPVQT